MVAVILVYFTAVVVHESATQSGNYNLDKLTK